MNSYIVIRGLGHF